jgi:hypothetical protein
MKNPSKGGKFFGKEKFLAEIFLMTENQLLLRLYHISLFFIHVIKHRLRLFKVLQ